MPLPSIQYAANFLFVNEKQFESSINYYKKGKTYPVSYLSLFQWLHENEFWIKIE